MNKFTYLLACFVLLLCTTPDTGASGYSDVKSDVSYTSVTELGFTQANARLVYGDDDPKLQYGLLWLPENLDTAEKAPLVVLIHGGCWLNQFDVEHSYPLSTALAQAGYAVWSLEYRRTGDAGGGWPGSFEDIRQALAYLPALEKYPLDLDRIVLTGHSAGGHLALLAGSEFQAVSAVIGLAAITDIIEYSRGENSCQTATAAFMGGQYEDQRVAYHAANPADRSLHPVTVLLHGDVDKIVPPGQSQLAGASTAVLEGAGHFDWIHPGTRAYRLLLKTLQDSFQK